VSGTRRSFALSFAQRYVDLALRLAGTVVLARLMSPTDFGVFAVATAIAALLWIVSEFGLPQYVINAERLDARERAGVFGTALAASTAVATVIAASALLAPASTLDPVLGDVLLVLVAGVLLQPFAIMFRSELQRNMRFDTLLVANTAVVACSVLVAIVLAGLGAGALSLAWANVAEGLCWLAIALGHARRWPFPVPSLFGWRRILGFGGAVSATNALRQAGDAAPHLALGALGGYAMTGVFSRAQSVASLFDKAVMQAVSPVVLPILARRLRTGNDVADLYLLKVAYVSALSWPFFGFVALWADSIVALLLGSQWRDTIPVVQLLCIAGVLLPFNQMNQKFFVALGLVKPYLWIQLATQSAKIAAVVALAVVSLEAMALAVSVEQAAKAALTWPSLKRRLGYSTAHMHRNLKTSAMIAVAALAGPMALFWLRDPPRDGVVELVAAASVAVVGWLVGVAATGHPLRRELARGVALLPRRPLGLGH
jgi:O-antigen/teichoic acid export membrane protein